MNLNLAPTTYGADRSGLVCGFRFAPDKPGLAVDTDSAAEWLEEAAKAPGGEFLWLHFNLSNTAAERWMRRHACLPEVFFSALHEGSHPTRVETDDKVLIVRGASHLLDTVEAQADIERVRTLFEDIERKADLIRLLELAKDGDGVRIFIGSENRLFSLSGSSIVAAPYANAAGKIVGVIGVLGPTRLNYGRIIPMVDHTAKVIGRLLG